MVWGGGGHNKYNIYIAKWRINSPLCCIVLYWNKYTADLRHNVNTGIQTEPLENNLMYHHVTILCFSSVVSQTH